MNRSITVSLVAIVAAAFLWVFIHHEEVAAENTTAPFYAYKVISVYPHNRAAFTQGLVFDDGYLYEGTGIRGRSALSKIDLKTGRVLQSRRLDKDLFGEGITIINDKVVQLTWQAGKALVYDKETFTALETFNYRGEAWGITNDGKRLIMSDGSARLYFINPVTFKVTGSIDVHHNGSPVLMLNELEYIEGYLYANVWRTDTIAIIDPRSGRVRAWMDLQALTKLSGGDRKVKTLNGIAWDAKGRRLLVTGKLWPWIYEIEVIETKE